jgi:hypothetical protein
VGSDVLMWEVENGIKPLSQSEQQARNLKKQQQDIKLRQKQLQVRTARERANKLAAQQTQIAQQRI